MIAPAARRARLRRLDHQRRRRAAMGRRAAVLGAVDGPLSGAALHRLRGRRSARSPTCRRADPGLPNAEPRDPDARYDVGCLYIGVNDVRSLDWDAAAFEARLHVRALAFVAERCDRTLARDRAAAAGPAAGRRQGSRRSTRSSPAARGRARRPGRRPRRLRRPQPRDGRPRPPDRVRPDRDRRARAGGARSATGCRRAWRPRR